MYNEWRSLFHPPKSPRNHQQHQPKMVYYQRMRVEQMVQNTLKFMENSLLDQTFRDNEGNIETILIGKWESASDYLAVSRNKSDRLILDICTAKMEWITLHVL
jgi:hypothetical protein